MLSKCMKKKNGFAILELLLIIIIFSVIISFVISIKYTFKQTRQMQLLVQIKKILEVSNTFKQKYGYMATDVLDDLNKNSGNKDNANLNFWQQLYDNKLLTQNSEIVNLKLPNEENLFFSIIEYNKNYYLHIASTKRGDKLLFTDSVLTPEDSLYIDRKIDDKVPTSGKVLAVSGDSVEDFFVRKPRRACAIENEYNVKNRKKACQLIINLN